MSYWLDEIRSLNLAEVFEPCLADAKKKELLMPEKEFRQRLEGIRSELFAHPFADLCAIIRRHVPEIKEEENS
jgi:hypothetical protein